MRVQLHPGGGAVVGHEHDDGVVGEPELVEAAQQEAEVVVDVGDHAVEAGAVLVRGGAGVGGGVVRLDVERAVRRVGGDVAVERLIAVLFDEAQALAEEHVGAVALEFRGHPVHEVGVVEVVVAPGVADVADAAAVVINGAFEAAFVRAERLAVAQVPLAELAGAVAGLAQGVGQGPLVLAQQRAPADGVPHPGAVAEVAGQQAGAGGRAGGADVEVGKAHRVAVEAVQVGGVDGIIAVAPQVAVALIVGEYENEVRSARRHDMAPILPHRPRHARRAWYSLRSWQDHDTDATIRLHRPPQYADPCSAGARVQPPIPPRTRRTASSNCCCTTASTTSTPRHSYGKRQTPRR